MKIILTCGHTINAFTERQFNNALEDCPGCYQEYQLENSLEG